MGVAAVLAISASAFGGLKAYDAYEANNAKYLILENCEAKAGILDYLIGYVMGLAANEITTQKSDDSDSKKVYDAEETVEFKPEKETKTTTYGASASLGANVGAASGSISGDATTSVTSEYEDEVPFHQITCNAGTQYEKCQDTGMHKVNGGNCGTHYE